MRRQFHFHITAPLALAVACISAIMRCVHWSYGMAATFTLAKTFIWIWQPRSCVWACGGAVGAGKTTVRSHCSVDGFQMELLGRSLFTTARGTSSHAGTKTRRACHVELKQERPLRRPWPSEALYRSWTWIDLYSVMKITQQDAVGGVDGLAFTGVRDGHVDRAVPPHRSWQLSMMVTPSPTDQTCRPCCQTRRGCTLVPSTPGLSQVTGAASSTEIFTERFS